MQRIDRTTILLIKELIGSDYQDKQISMITKVSRSYINKIRNGQFRKNVELKPNEKTNITEEQKIRLNTLNKLIAAPELINSTTSEQDLIYIHVLKFFGIAKDEVFNLYFHLSKKQLGRYWMKADVNILNFDSRLIGIPIRDYLDLVIDYFI